MEISKCCVRRCQGRSVARKLCRKHYMQTARRGRVLSDHPKRKTKKRCAVESCPREAFCKALCAGHYDRLRTKGDPNPDKPLRAISREPQPCKVVGCKKTAKALGMCEAHWTRWNKGDRGARLSRPLRIHTGSVKRGQQCVVAGCAVQAKSRKMCPMHYTRWQKTGDPGEAERRNAPKGRRRWKDENGYIHISRGHLGVMEHRAIMEDRIGRPLLSHETVHHKNLVRDDNRPKNLELWSSKHAKGARVSDLVQYAKEILAIYDPIIAATRST